MKCLNLRHYPVCCDIKNNDKFKVCKNYYVFDPNVNAGIDFFRTKKSANYVEIKNIQNAMNLASKYNSN